VWGCARAIGKWWVHGFFRWFFSFHPPTHTLASLPISCAHSLAHQFRSILFWNVPLWTLSPSQVGKKETKNGA
jgi:hypothetical protein